MSFPAAGTGATSQDCVVYAPATSVPSACLVGASASQENGALGTERTITFICGSGIAQFPGPLGPGCYNVRASLMDVTDGSAASFDTATCGATSVPTNDTVSCAPTVNPICAAGYEPASAGPCAPCPRGSQVVAGTCHSMPVNGACVNSTPVYNITHTAIVYCTAPELPSTPTPYNELVLTFGTGTPHSYAVQITGLIPAGPGGACPPSTTYTAQGSLTSTVTGPACAFTLEIVQRSVEITNIVVTSLPSCNSSIGPGVYNSVNGLGCLADIQAFGTVVLKVGVNCSNGTEPSTGTSAAGVGFPVGSFYQCVGDALSVANILVPNVPLSVTAMNAVLNPLCFPLYPTEGTPGTITPTPSVTPIATARPTATPSVTATATAGPRAPGSGPATCAPTGSNTIQVVTGPNGHVNFFGTEAEFSASANPPNPSQNQLEDIAGFFAIDGVPRAGVPMYSQYIDAYGVSVSCGPGLTDAAGVAHCKLPTDTSPAGTPVFANVDFILNCTDYMTTVSFTVGGSPVATPAPIIREPAPNGLCLVRTGPGPITLRVVYTSAVDTQPTVDTGQIQIGQATFQTPTPLPTMQPTATPLPTFTPTLTPTVTPTFTPTPTSTPTATPTSTPTPTATATSTPSPTPTKTPPPVNRTLRFSLDAARVSKLSDRGNRRGLNYAQQGQRVNLSMYYTVVSLPKALTRTTTYTIFQGNRTIFKATYRGVQGAQEVGVFVRYIPYRIPAALPAGIYAFQATLQIGPTARRRSWTFAIVRRAIIARPGR